MAYIHEADMDYSASNEPDEEALSAMMDQAERLAAMLGGGAYPPAITERRPQGRRWVADQVWDAPASPQRVARPPERRQDTGKPPAPAFARRAAYDEARKQQAAQGGGPRLSDERQRIVNDHIALIERAANDLDLLDIKSEVMTSALSTLRLALLGIVRATSPVG